jgi:hypothetical protein
MFLMHRRCAKGEIMKIGRSLVALAGLSLMFFSCATYTYTTISNPGKVE